MVVVMRRGQVWVVNLNPNKGSEAGKIRPVVIVQADAVNKTGLGTIVVVPLTTQHRPATDPLRVLLPARERLLKDCYAMADQVRVADRSRFGDGPLATLTADEMGAVERGLKAVLGIW